MDVLCEHRLRSQIAYLLVSSQAGGLLPDGLLEIMQCPRCAGVLEEDVSASQLRCTGCGTRYPVDDGIPNMLDDAAIDPDPDGS